MPELKVTVDRDKLKYYHATVNDVAQSFNAAIGGRSAGVLANDVQTMAMTPILQYVLPVAVAMILKTCALFQCRQAEEASFLATLPM